MFIPNIIIENYKDLNSYSAVYELFDSELWPKFPKAIGDAQLHVLYSSAIRLLKCFYDNDKLTFNKDDVCELVRFYIQDRYHVPRRVVLNLECVTTNHPSNWSTGKNAPTKDSPEVMIRKGSQCECGAIVSKTTHAPWCPIKNC